MPYLDRGNGNQALSKRLFSRQEVARVCGVSPALVGKWIRADRLKAVQIGFGGDRRHVRVTPEALEAFLNESKEVAR